MIGCYTQCTFREGPIGRENCKLDPGPQKLNHKKITKQLLNGTELRRQIYPSLMRCYSCFPENCQEKRAVHVASGVPFSCEHYNVAKSCSLPTSAKNLQEEDIKSYNSDNSTQRMLLDALQPPEDFRHVV